MKKTIVYSVLRWLSVAVILGILIGKGAQNKISSAAFDDVVAAVEPTMVSDSVQKADTQLVKRLYGLDPADYEGLELYAPVSNMDAEELLIIKLKDLSQQETVSAAVEKRLQTQKKSFDGYGAEQFALLNDSSVIEMRGNYLLFAVSKNSGDAKAAFLRAI